jgi:hypothetical protein
MLPTCRYQLAMAGWGVGYAGGSVTLEVLGADTILLYSIGTDSTEVGADAGRPTGNSGSCR